MTETLCSSGAVKIKAGANCPTLTAAEYTQAINWAEGFINLQGRYDFVGAWAGISGMAAAKVLEDTASSKAAILIINNNMGGYTSRTEAQTMLDVNYSIVADNINLIRDDKFKKFLQTGVVN